MLTEADEGVPNVALPVGDDSANVKLRLPAKAVVESGTGMDFAAPSPSAQLSVPLVAV
jgi:hypothetical protein